MEKVRRRERMEAATVMPYREEFRSAFEQLNREWIETHFVLEEADREIFRDPATKVLGAGGQIFFVLESAIRLYQKHGFVRVPLVPDERYQRANIRMERELSARAPAVLPATDE